MKFLAMFCKSQNFDTTKYIPFLYITVNVHGIFEKFHVTSPVMFGVTPNLVSRAFSLAKEKALDTRLRGVTSIQ